MRFRYLYNSTTGEFAKRDDGGKPVEVGIGYSGCGAGKNNPDMENRKSLGPVPIGAYMIGQPHFSHQVGPVAMHLVPVGHSAHNRTGLMIHGDNSTHTASRGCIVLGRTIRDEIANEWRMAVAGDTQLGLEVI